MAEQGCRTGDGQDGAAPLSSLSPALLLPFLVAGPVLPALIARTNAHDPHLLIELRIGSSGDLLQGYDRREAAPSWRHRADEPLPVATLAEPAASGAGPARRSTTRAPPRPRSSWAAAVTAGLGVAALASHMLPLGAVDVGNRLGLPALPRLPILIHSRLAEGRPCDAVAALAAALRSAVRE